MTTGNDSKYGRPGKEVHDKNESQPNWGDDHRNPDPAEEKKRAENREESSEKFEKNSAKDESSDSTHPDHKKDTQTKLSEDPTRKNEANQGASDLRTRSRTHFRREGESRPEPE